MAYKGIDKVDDFFMHYGRKGMKRGMNIYNPDYRPIGEKAKAGGSIDVPSKGGTMQPSDSIRPGAKGSMTPFKKDSPSFRTIPKAITPKQGKIGELSNKEKTAIMNKMSNNSSNASGEAAAKERAFRSSQKYASDRKREAIMNAERERHSSYAKSASASAAEREKESVSKKANLARRKSELSKLNGGPLANLDTLYDANEAAYAGLKESERKKIAESAWLMVEEVLKASGTDPKAFKAQFDFDGSLEDTALVNAFMGEIMLAINDGSNGEFQKAVDRRNEQYGTTVGGRQDILTNLNGVQLNTENLATSKTLEDETVQSIKRRRAANDEEARNRYNLATTKEKERKRKSARQSLVEQERKRQEERR